MIWRLFDCLEFNLLVPLLAQIGPRLEIVEPFPSPELLTTIGLILGCLWFFTVGASVGSFLNVVAYRLPAGMSLSSPGSHCPRCNSPIRLRHNIPILGWLILRGRCADCQLPISSRYPLVELLVACLFLLVGGLEIIGQGVNLPRRNPGSWRPPLTTKEPVPLGVAVTMHCLLVSTLVGAALVDHDGQRVPYRLAIPVILFAIVGTCWWPQVHPWSAGELPGLPVTEKMADNAEWWFVDLLPAICAGLVCGPLMALGFWVRPALKNRYAGRLTLLWLAVGLVFGWHLIPWLFACWGLTFLIAVRVSPDKSPQPALGLAAVAIGALFIWRWIAGYSLVLSDAYHWQLNTMTIMLFLGWLCLLVATCQLPLDLAFAAPSSPYNERLPEDANPAPVEDSPLPADESTTS